MSSYPLAVLHSTDTFDEAFEVSYFRMKLKMPEQTCEIDVEGRAVLSNVELLQRTIIVSSQVTIYYILYGQSIASRIGALH